MISIIIPTYNEAGAIEALIRYLRLHGSELVNEIIVSDGGSTDNTLELAGNAGATPLLSPGKGRAAQMNYGVTQTTGDILYFVHADTYPPPSFAADIQKAIQEGYGLGRFRTTFNSKKNILRLNAFFTRFDLFVCYGGDQTLFITRNLFSDIGGFNNGMLIMEDYDIVQRARLKARYRILPASALVSARKYDENSWWQIQRANYIIVQMFKKGAAQQAMCDRYKALLRLPGG